MYSEKLPGLNILGKINLDDLPSGRFDKNKAPKPETYLPSLQAKLESQAERLNDQYGHFLNRAGQMEMVGPSLDEDQLFIELREKTWAQEVGKSEAEMRASKEKNPANITEMATTLLFDKIIGDKFIIVRASTYDDYANGADQLIIDKETGAVICGLDDVIGNIGDDGGEVKEKKIRAKMKHGGAEIKYGATMVEGGLKRQSLDHIPMFYFSLSKKELDSILAALTEDREIVTASEISVYTKLVDSLVAQAASFTADSSLHPQLRNNLRNLQPSIEKMLTLSNPHLAKAI